MIVSRAHRRAAARSEEKKRELLRDSAKTYNELLGWIPTVFEEELFKNEHASWDELFTTYNGLWVNNAKQWNATRKLQIDVNWFEKQFGEKDQA